MSSSSGILEALKRKLYEGDGESSFLGSAAPLDHNHLHHHHHRHQPHRNEHEPQTQRLYYLEQTEQTEQSVEKENVALVTEIDELTREKEATEEMMDRQTQEVDEALEENRHLRELLLHAKAESIKMSAQAEGQRRRCLKADKREKENASKIQTLQELVVELEDKQIEHQQSIQEGETIRLELSRHLSQAQTRLWTTVNQHEEMQEIMKQKDLQLHRSMEMLSDTQSQLEACRRRADDLASARDQALEECKALKQRELELKAKGEQYFSVLGQLKVMTGDMAEEAKGLKEQITFLAKRQRGMEMVMREMESFLAGGNHDFAVLRSKFNDAVAELSRCRHEMTIHVKKHKEVEKENYGLQIEISRITLEADALQVLNDDLRLHCQSLTHSAERQSEGLTQASLQLNEQLALSQHALQSAEAKIEALQEELKEVQKVSQMFAERAGKEKRFQEAEMTKLVEAVTKYQQHEQQQQALMDSLKAKHDQLLSECIRVQEKEASASSMAKEMETETAVSNVIRQDSGRDPQAPLSSELRCVGGVSLNPPRKSQSWHTQIRQNSIRVRGDSGDGKWQEGRDGGGVSEYVRPAEPFRMVPVFSVISQAAVPHTPAGSSISIRIPSVVSIQHGSSSSSPSLSVDDGDWEGGVEEEKGATFEPQGDSPPASMNQDLGLVGDSTRISHEGAHPTTAGGQMVNYGDLSDGKQDAEKGEEQPIALTDYFSSPAQRALRFLLDRKTVSLDGDVV